MGFPVREAAGRRRAEQEGYDPPPRTWRPLTKNPADFEVLVDGKRQSFRSMERATEEETEIVHLWRQRFPAGVPVRVSHRYRASPDGMSVGPGAADVEVWQRLARRYCVGPGMAAAKDVVPITRVRYVLTTGANWSGPIRHFHLVLKKKKAQQKVSLCLDGLVKTSPTTFELDQRDFTPTADLQLIFFE